MLTFLNARYFQEILDYINAALLSIAAKRVLFMELFITFHIKASNYCLTFLR